MMNSMEKLSQQIQLCFSLSLRPQMPWDLALDVGFLDFFIWKLFRLEFITFSVVFIFVMFGCIACSMISSVLQERLEREYDLSLITTAPSVVYRVHCSNGDTVNSFNPVIFHLFALDFQFGEYLDNDLSL